jgi:DNA-binding NarL/FixJ family response regulator
MNILLVEDSKLIAARVRDLLAAEPGINILATVGDQQAAIDAIRSAHVDVICSSRLALALACSTRLARNARRQS